MKSYSALLPHLEVMSNSVFLSVSAMQVLYVFLLLHTFSLKHKAEKTWLLVKVINSSECGVLEQGIKYNMQDNSRTNEIFQPEKCHDLFDY